MSTLPSEWIECIFEECNKFQSKTVDPAQFSDETFELYSVPSFPTGIPEYVKGRDIGSTKQMVQAGDVLVCKINPRINRVWQVKPSTDFRQIASSEWIVMRAPELNSAYLKYYFSSPDFRELICEGVTGVGGSLTRAQPKNVATFPIPLAPLNEQGLITDKLEMLLANVDTCKQRLDRLAALIRRFRQSVLSAATSGELTTEWREVQENLDLSSELAMRMRNAKEHGANSLFSEVDNHSTNETSLPASWTWVRLENLVPQGGIFDGPFGSSLKTEDYTLSGVQVVRLENIGHLQFFGEKRTYISEAKHATLKRHTVYPGDIIFASFISEELRVCVLPDLDVTAIAKADCFCLRPFQDVNRDFLSFQLASHETYMALEENIHGVTRPRINTTQLKSLFVRMCGVAEQAEIVRRVRVLFSFADRLEDRIRIVRQAVDQVIPAVLSKAFRGELVPQDPNDEPASILIERIQHARTEQQRVPRPPSTKRTKVLAKTLQEIAPTHLTDTLLENGGKLTPEELLRLSELTLDDFYTQIKREMNTIRDVRPDEQTRFLEAIS